ATSGGAGRAGSGGMRGEMRAGSGGMRAVVLALLLCGTGGTELTFELPDSDRQCFHQELDRGTKFTLDYQVLPCPHPLPLPPLPLARSPSAGLPGALRRLPPPAHLAPLSRTALGWGLAETPGRRALLPCPRPPPPGPSCATAGAAEHALSPQMESACVTIHEALNTVIDSQTHYRLREAQDRSRAEDLNGRVSYWSVGETFILFVVSVGQVMLLKSFFTEKRPGSGGAST
ncbi:TMED3 protein, partial [Rostratula benghalensis]|nr:TMED3 protein [Rostratula benghalensis]